MTVDKNPFEKASHDDYDDVESPDQLDNSINPDPKILPKPRTEDDPKLDAAP